MISKLEDLFVKPEYRSKGVGKRFFGELGKIAQEKVCRRVFRIWRGTNAITLLIEELRPARLVRTQGKLLPPH